ncbi:type II toxin-antitoxin system HipA family toxin [Rhodocista pekingensis]|uniref:Type II toxin-antitoxin system HipA family toxin n=1 Tax=Rhodocista pekingensis TaxID=201185 RepID=A0ABW2L1U7_9PROT
MSSERDAYVWIWLPGQTEPVVCGRLIDRAGRLSFIYGRSYLDRPDAIPIYTPELPLRRGEQEPLGTLSLPSCIRDASPDAWGRRVIINRLMGQTGAAAEAVEPGELTFLLESGSDRIGALDFQASPTAYVPRSAANASLEELLEAANRVEQGLPLNPDLDRALYHGTSIGGARPKALIDQADRKWIAKFSASNDTYSVVKAEFIAMRLAALAGLHVAPVRMVRAVHRDVLLVERFDRVRSAGGWTRTALVSALTLQGLDEMEARYASYDLLAEIVRHRFHQPKATLRELFGRIVFNILVGNTDDHARNHAAFWDGTMLTLTPAYDICPQARTGREAGQAMLIAGSDRSSRIATCLAAAPIFHLSKADALHIVEGQVTTIGDNWQAVCDEAELTVADRRLFWGRQFLNPFAFDGLDGTSPRLRVPGT